MTKPPAPKPAEHTVGFWVEGKNLKHGKNADCLCVRPGDRITWKLRNKLSYFVMIKAYVSPLDISYDTKPQGGEIKAKVLENAVPGIYAYAVGAFDGEELLIDDPDIIIRPPDGRRK
jgi:hypothetical protein